MPTPFSHLWIAHQLLHDEALPPDVQAVIHADIPAFLLGGIVADAKPTPDSDREVTHFYRYDRPMPDHAWREMIRQHPSLAHPTGPTHRAFLAGYIAHLATDEYWSKFMLGPHFANGSWGEDIRWRFYVLHLLLTTMDERDQKRLPEEDAIRLAQAEPDHWLPFMDDAVIVDWRDYIAKQLTQENASDTIAIFSARIHRDPDEMRRLLDDPQQMQDMLWDHITPQLLNDLEAQLYSFSVEQMMCYISESI
ncbi:zinc dependent phospholipase C family protein [Phototrophicus methaneseepsis]|uniref:Zinc dependent phospholipase C family protein n=1 Tax=Phototrophicus methaneseepsis TaxID=2710758 RepID=A0A7S8IFI6_9CHLR|nr:zinc dependent phospholipase C family protein [Phototrophicus methaneseepsis]QPC82993.1 zinc dependent phospholipase C family protein [Phototrophicus methaneseepsis]